MKNYTQNVVKKLFPDHFLKNQNWPYLQINVLKFYIFSFYCLPSWGLSKVIETKLQTTCLVLPIFVNQVATSKILKLTISFLLSCFFDMMKSQNKNLNTTRPKRAFKTKSKAFFIISQRLSLKHIKRFVLEGESPTLISWNAVFFTIF